MAYKTESKKKLVLSLLALKLKQFLKKNKLLSDIAQQTQGEMDKECWWPIPHTICFILPYGNTKQYPKNNHIRKPWAVQMLT